MSVELNIDQLKVDRINMSVKEMAQKYGKSERTMSRILSKHGLTQKTDRDDIFDEDICSDYLGGMSINDIANKYQASHDTITKRLKKYGYSHNRADGIRRHFNKTYYDRWPAIKVDLDVGMTKSEIRDKHKIRMENLDRLMAEHGY